MAWVAKGSVRKSEFNSHQVYFYVSQTFQFEARLLMVQRTTKICERPSPEEVLLNWENATWQSACSRMQTCLAHGSLENAICVLKQFSRRAIPHMASLDTHVGEIFHFRLAKMLEDAGYLNLRSLDLATDEELKRIPLLGDGNLEFIRTTLTDVAAGRRLAIDVLEDFEGLAK